MGNLVTLKINTDEKSSETLGIIGTVGIGYRRLSRNEHAYVGVNAFVDQSFYRQLQSH